MDGAWAWLDLAGSGLWVVAFAEGRLLGLAPAEEEEALRRSLWRRGVRLRQEPGPPPRVVRRAILGLSRPAPQRMGDWQLGILSPFEREVHRVVLALPAGQVRPYGWVAREAGAPRAARAVGRVLAGSPFGDLVPWHRVGLALGPPRHPGFGEKARRQMAEGVPLARLERLLSRGDRVLGDRTRGQACLPTCPEPDLERVTPLAGPRAAQAAGYAPCPRCRPW